MEFDLIQGELMACNIWNISPVRAFFQQVFCAMQWLRSAILKFTTIIRLLADFLETVYIRIGKLQNAPPLMPNYSASASERSKEMHFYNCKNALANQTTLAYHEARFRLCVYTDESDLVWSRIVSQVQRMDLSKSVSNQHINHLHFSPTVSVVRNLAGLNLRGKPMQQW